MPHDPMSHSPELECDNSQIFIYLSILKATIFLIVVTWIGGITTAAAQPLSLFTIPAISADDRHVTDDTWTDPTIVRSRDVMINFRVGQTADQPQGVAVQDTAGLYLNLFDDVGLMSVNDYIEAPARGQTVWVGHIEDEPLSQVVLVIKDGLLVGNIFRQDAFYQIRYGANGLHRVREIDQTAFPPEAEPLQAALSKNRQQETLPDPIAADSGDTIDVLVVYTPQARSGAGGTANMEALIDLAIAETNTTYANSGINQRLRLVHSAEVSYSDSGNTSTDLCRLTLVGTTSLPYPCPYADYSAMDTEVQPLRDTHGADEVVLLVENGGGYCGVAWVNSSASTAFAVVARGCAAGYYTFGHELGHNMGCQHDRRTAGKAPPTADDGQYYYGYYYEPASWRTVMSYNCPTGCSRTPYWSNPDVTYGGIPMGVPDAAAYSADNRKRLNETAFAVANFRQTVLPPACRTAAVPHPLLTVI